MNCLIPQKFVGFQNAGQTGSVPSIKHNISIAIYWRLKKNSSLKMFYTKRTGSHQVTIAKYLAFFTPILALLYMWPDLAEWVTKQVLDTSIKSGHKSFHKLKIPCQYDFSLYKVTLKYSHDNVIQSKTQKVNHNYTKV